MAINNKPNFGEMKILTCYQTINVFRIKISLSLSFSIGVVVDHMLHISYLDTAVQCILSTLQPVYI